MWFNPEHISQQDILLKSIVQVKVSCLQPWQESRHPWITGITTIIHMDLNTTRMTLLWIKGWINCLLLLLMESLPRPTSSLMETAIHLKIIKCHRLELILLLRESCLQWDCLKKHYRIQWSSTTKETSLMQATRAVEQFLSTLTNNIVFKASIFHRPLNFMQTYLQIRFINRPITHQWLIYSKLIKSFIIPCKLDQHRLLSLPIIIIIIMTKSCILSTFICSINDILLLMLIVKFHLKISDPIPSSCFLIIITSMPISLLQDNKNPTTTSSEKINEQARPLLSKNLSIQTNILSLLHPRQLLPSSLHHNYIIMLSIRMEWDLLLQRQPRPIKLLFITRETLLMHHTQAMQLQSLSFQVNIITNNIYNTNSTFSSNISCINFNNNIILHSSSFSYMLCTLNQFIRTSFPIISLINRSITRWFIQNKPINNRFNTNCLLDLFL